MKIYPFLSVLALVLLLGACAEDFLTTEPITEKTDGNYYTSPEEASEALVGCYDALQLIWSGTGVSMPVAADVMSDLCFGGTGAGDGDGYPMLDEFDQGRSPGDLNMFEGNWINYYKGIFRCNTLIAKLNQVEWGNQEQLSGIIEAEARFLRAFFYFDMVRMFGYIPLLTEPSNENIPQSDPDEVYAVIANDLLFAIENGNDTPFETMVDSDYGHANKWAAQALLARVYLYYTGYYNQPDLVGLVSQTQVLTHLEDLILNSGHDLVENYADLWPAAATYEAAQNSLPITDATYAGETNKEIIFAIKYTHTSDYNGNTDGNHWLVMNGLRKMAWPASGYGDGWGACTVPAEVYSTWPAGDSRREASVMAIAEEGINYTQIKDVKEYTGYFTKKYIPTCDASGNSNAMNNGAVDFMIGQYQDFFSIRFADVLLMAAELGSADALTYVNRVHTRGGLLPLSTVDKDVIFEERRLEFAFEGLRYWDLLRYDHTLNYAASQVAFSGTVLTGNAAVEKIIDGANLIKTRGLFQIPNNQITLSGGVLKQNSGWE
jgi:hypothetical protein